MFLGIAPAAAAPPTRLDYVALGDSIAAGVRAMYGELPGWETSSDYGYTDLVAQYLKDLGLLGKFNEKYAISGQTSGELLAIILESKPARNTLSKAEIVTITVGADDLLGPLYDYYDYCLINEVDFDVNSDGFFYAMIEIMTNLSATGATLESNLESIIQNIIVLNPNVQIYVMGYYNPLPLVIDNSTLNTFNYFIEEATLDVDPDQLNTMYVPTIGDINSSEPTYAYNMGYLLPDTGYGFPDIHPTEDGYQAIFPQFKAEIDYDFIY